MLTPLTQKAIAVLRDIAYQEKCAEDICKMKPGELATVLARLERGNLIEHIPNGPEDVEASYRLRQSLSEISLLDVLEAIGEHLNCNHPTTEEFYQHYGRVAQRLGVVNHITRLYLAEIKLTEC